MNVSVYTHGRFYAAIMRRWRLLTAMTAAPALVAGLIIGVEVHVARWGPPPTSDPGSPVAVHVVHGRKAVVVPMRPYRTPPAMWPAAQSATVTVAGSLVRVGDTPVYVGPASSGPRVAAAAPVQVRVTVAPRQTAAALGVHGMVFMVAPAGADPGGQVHVSVDYSGFAHAFGGDFAGRLHLVQLPGCALTTPQVASCRAQLPVRSGAGDDSRVGRAGGDVMLPGAPATSSARSTVLLADTSSAGVVLAVTGAPSGDGGNFAVPPFSEASEWVSGASSGTYSYSYPVQVPPVPGGFAPAVTLRYSSQLTDGLTSATNTQASWIGDGWDYQPGYIEQDYPICSGTTLTAHVGEWCTSLPANAGATPALTLSLNGTQSPIVTGASGMRAEADGGATITSGSGGSMVVTQRDGTTLYFGLNQLPGYASGDAVTSSQWTLPAWNPSTSTYQNVAWRLMLDYETDRHGNSVAFFYTPQQNWYAEAGSTTGTGQYTRSGTLSKITYGFPDGHAYDQAPPGEVDFTTTGGRQDVPTDLACSQGGSCTVTVPSFWGDQELTAIATRALVGGVQKLADVWALSQTFPVTGDPLTAPSLWLSAITQTGQDGSTPITLPPTSFSGTSMSNRVMTAADTSAGYSPITRFRLTSVTNTAGGVTTISYTPHDPACATGSYPTADTNTAACYPNSWSPSSGGGPVLDWWNVYAVATRTVTDTTGGDPPVVTRYTYTGPAWHYDNDTVSRSVTQTFDGWRGFRTVTSQTGTAPDPVTQTTDTYFQGMSKDCAASSCPQGTPVTLTSSRGSTAEDSNGYAGMTFEEITYNGAGTGTEVTDTIHNAIVIATTETGTGIWAGVTANITGDSAVATYTALAGGGVRESVTSYTYDRNGRLTQETDQPDLNDPSQWTCTPKAYGSFDLVTEADTYSYVSINGNQTCATLASSATVAQMQSAAVSATSNSYDMAGNLTQVQKGTAIIAAGTGTCPPDTLKNPHTACWAWQTTQTSTYDSYGRALTSTDADNRTTTTGYTPSVGAEPTMVTVTDPMGLVTTTTYDPVRDLPLTVTDPAGYQTVKAYDALGRVTSQWTPGNPASGPAVDLYAYTESNAAPSYTTEQTEEPDGGYLTTITISDSLGQVREVQQQTVGGGSDITDTAYNSDGWKALTSSPYYSSGAPSGTLVTAPSSSIPSQTGYAYDGDGRVVKQVAYKNGTSTWETDTSYGGNYTTVVPPVGGTSQTTFTDARGLTTAIYQYHAGVPADPSDPAADYDKTSYTYTAGNSLATVTDAAGNQWSSTYDLLGNQLTQSTPDSGTTTSSYDPAGQLMSVTDARGKTTSFTYDGDSRKTAEYDTTGGALESAADMLASWTWDTLAKGKPTSSTAYQGGAQYTEQVSGYDSHGEPTGEQTIIPSAQGALAGTYVQTYSYAPDASRLPTPTPQRAGSPPRPSPPATTPRASRPR